MMYATHFLTYHLFLCRFAAWAKSITLPALPSFLPRAGLKRCVKLFEADWMSFRRSLLLQSNSFRIISELEQTYCQWSQPATFSKHGQLHYPLTLLAIVLPWSQTGCWTWKERNVYPVLQGESKVIKFSNTNHCSIQYIRVDCLTLLVWVTCLHCAKTTLYLLLEYEFDNYLYYK